MNAKKSAKVIGFGVDKQSKNEMLQMLTTVSLPQTYCRSCHLATRSDIARCLHCNKPLIEPASPKRTLRRAKVRRHSR